MSVLAKEVEVAPEIGLFDVSHVQALIATDSPRNWRRPLVSPPAQLGIIKEHVKPTCRDIEPDEVAFLDERERSTDGRLRGDVQDARPVSRAAHACVADSHHVGHASPKQALWEWDMTSLGHPRRSYGAETAKDEHVVRLEPHGLIIDSVENVLKALEDTRSALMLHEHGICRGDLENRPIGTEVA